MSKKALYLPEAERLYTQDLLTLEEIASRLPVAERTLRYWKEEGAWDDKKKQATRSRQAFHEELYEFVRTLMKKIKEDLLEGNEISQSRMYAFVNLIPRIYKLKEYEEAVTEMNTKLAKEGVSDKDKLEDTQKLINDILGLS